MIIIILVILFGLWVTERDLFRRPMGRHYHGMPGMWHRPPVRGPHMGGFGGPHVGGGFSGGHHAGGFGGGRVGGGGFSRGGGAGRR